MAHGAGLWDCLLRAAIEAGGITPTGVLSWSLLESSEPSVGSHLSLHGQGWTSDSSGAMLFHPQSSSLDALELTCPELDSQDVVVVAVLGSSSWWPPGGHWGLRGQGCFSWFG